MAELFNDKVEITDGGANITIKLDANTGDLSAGGSGKDGDLVLRDASGNVRVTIDGQSGLIRVRNSSGVVTAQISAGGDVVLGGSGADGDLTLRSSAGHNRIRLDGDGALIRMGGAGAHSHIRMYRSGASPTVGNSAATIHIDGGGGNIWAGGHGADGDLVLLPSGATDVNDTAQATIHLDAGGTQALFKSGGQTRARIDGAGGNVWLGGNGADGDLVLFASDGDGTTLSQSTIHLDGNSGDIILRNADCAEDFDVAGDATIEPGSVVVLDDNGEISESREPYATAVAGVVSGAGAHQPGIIMDRNDTGRERLPIALVGKVFCKADASFGAIEVGSLMTSSATPGHAMRAGDPQRAFGAVLGKALKPLAAGRGLIPVLVALQ